MKKNVIKINESTLRQIITESIKKALNEDNFTEEWSVNGYEIDPNTNKQENYVDYDLMHDLSYEEAVDACHNIVINNPNDIIVVWPENINTKEKGKLIATKAAKQYLKKTLSNPF